MKPFVTSAGSVLWELILPVALFVAWWVWSVQGQSMYFPAVPEILRAFGHTWFGTGFTEHVLPSLRNFIVGLAIGTFFGIVCGIAIGRVMWLRWLLGPIIE